jgi:hypothetical protein
MTEAKIKRVCLNCGKERLYPEGWKKVYLGLKHRPYAERCGVCIEAAAKRKKEKINAVS